MKLKKFLCTKAVKCFNALAVLMIIQTANSACIWVAHQPEFPVEANRYKKAL